MKFKTGLRPEAIVELSGDGKDAECVIAIGSPGELARSGTESEEFRKKRSDKIMEIYNATGKKVDLDHKDLAPFFQALNVARARNNPIRDQSLVDSIKYFNNSARQNNVTIFVYAGSRHISGNKHIGQIAGIPHVKIIDHTEDAPALR